MKKLDPIRWTPAMLTGVEEIDRQHRVLVNTLNELIQHLGTAPGEDLAERVTRDLLGYALYHFEMEEGLMRQYDYARNEPLDARHHHEQHLSFAERVGALRERVNCGRALDLEALLKFLHGWLIQHIMNTDQRLGRFIASRRADAPPPT